MAKFKITRSALFTAGICDEIQSLTGASTATAITNHGVTKITIASGTESATVAQLVYQLAAPIAGVHKYIVADVNTTKTVQIRTNSSVCTFFGSTKNALAYSTVISDPPLPIHLIGGSTAQWIVVNGLGTTGSVTVAGATA
jgi:hypothetical protein